MDDNEIVELYLSRDEAAIEQTALKYGAALRAIARSVLKDASAAEECEYDAYMQAWSLIPPNEPRDRLFAFMGSIVRHIAIDRCRKSSAAKRSAIFCELTDEMEQCLPGPSTVEGEAEADETAAAISRYLEGVSPEKRVMFIRRYWFFDSVPEICLRCGCSRAKVKTTLFRMRKELKTYLEKEGKLYE